MTFQVGDWVEFGVYINDHETGPGTVRRVVDDTVDVQMDNGRKQNTKEKTDE
jgi:hypothetical protein